MMLPIEKLTNIRLISMEYLSVLDYSSVIYLKKSKTKVEERHCVRQCHWMKGILWLNVHWFLSTMFVAHL